MTSSSIALEARDGAASGAPRPRARDRTNISDTERWISIAGGAALAAYGLSRRSWSGLALGAVGGALVARGITRHDPIYAALRIDTAHPGTTTPGNVLAAILPASTREIERAVTIQRPREELFRFWRDLSNLPRFMSNLESVTVLDDRRSHWTVKAPVGGAVEWDAEITDEIENELIAWRSLRTDVENAGSVRFTDAPQGRGTVVKVNLRYAAPGGRVGVAIASLFGDAPDQEVREDLRRFKQIMEAGETPTTDGQPSGRARRPKREENAS